jgi:hypothetical protein
VGDDTERRFTRLTNAFSKKFESHEAAVALYVAHYNFCRVHETLRITPAMQLGVTDHIWSIGELVDAAMSNEAPKPVGRQAGPFRIIDGGRESKNVTRLIRLVRARQCTSVPALSAPGHFGDIRSIRHR